MKLAFFGPSLVSAYRNGAAAYYRGLIRALAQRGHRVTFYEPNAFDRKQHQDIPNPDWARVVFYPATDEGVFEALERSEESDLIIKCSGVGVFDELLEAAVLELKRPETLVAFLDADAVATLDRIQKNAEDDFHNLIPEYDFILTHGGGQRAIDGYRAAGATECFPIYNALDPHTHFPVSFDSRFVGGLSLLENRTPDCEQQAEEFFLKPASKMSNQKFILGGNGWDNKTLPSNVQYLGHIASRDHNAFNCSPLAVLNINRDSTARYGFSPPARVFEAAGAGACVITDDWEGIEMFLEPGREVLVAKNGDEVAEHLERLTPESANRIGQAAHRRVLNEHTYAQRAALLEQILQEKVIAA